MSESVRKHRKWLECAAKWRNRRGNILILCPEVVQGGPTNWNEQNMCIGRGAAYHRVNTPPKLVFPLLADEGRLCTVGAGTG
jgi:hypothetical protein